MSSKVAYLKDLHLLSNVPRIEISHLAPTWKAGAVPVQFDLGDFQKSEDHPLGESRSQPVFGTSEPVAFEMEHGNTQMGNTHIV